jgi:cell division protein FtsI/penicillin-binding protein 2
VSFVLSSSLSPAQPTLYSQSLQIALVARNPQLEFLLLDLRTHETLANTFAATSIPPGSLLKPFIAVGYAHAHQDAFPTVVCHGHSDRCWKPTGHGAIALKEAIAQSCNAYFLNLAANLTPSGLASIPWLPAPPDSAPETLIGLNSRWRIEPSALVDAYASLLASSTKTQAAILAGMKASASEGTAARIGHHPGGVLAKTGTAPCVDQPCAATGDGLVVAAFPATHPTLLLLVRRRATNGATAAVSAGRILTQLEALHAE